MTLDELTLSAEVYHSAQVYAYGSVVKDIEPGVFTQASIDDMVAQAADYQKEYPLFYQHTMALASALEASGDIAVAPAPFTADEILQMNFILKHGAGTPGVAHDVRTAEHVGFWSDVLLGDLRAHEDGAYHLGHHTTAAVEQLTTDLLAGNQLLSGVVGIHHAAVL